MDGNSSCEMQRKTEKGTIAAKPAEGNAEVFLKEQNCFGGGVYHENGKADQPYKRLGRNEAAVQGGVCGCEDGFSA